MAVTILNVYEKKKKFLLFIKHFLLPIIIVIIILIDIIYIFIYIYIQMNNILFLQYNILVF